MDQSSLCDRANTRGGVPIFILEAVVDLRGVLFLPIGCAQWRNQHRLGEEQLLRGPSFLRF